MRIVIDGLPTTATSSLGVVVERVLEGWQQLDVDDEIHMVATAGAQLTLPDAVHLHEVPAGRPAMVGRLRAQNVVVPRLCRELHADVMLGVIPATVVAPLPCARVVIAYDLRHELLPGQFSLATKALRKVSYGLGWRQTDGVACISDRTRRDLLRSRPWLEDRPVRVALLGSDHVATWAADPTEVPSAVAFGQHGNKNVDMVIDAWAILRAEGHDPLPLHLMGMPPEGRAAAAERAARLGLADLVTPEPWVPIEELRRRFASAGLFVFPSDFEGFGLPAVEAMRLGIPLVITPDPALLEVTGGHGTVMDGWDARALADAVVRARATTAEQLAAARARAETFTWAGTAAAMRSTMVEAIEHHRSRRTS